MSGPEKRDDVPEVPREIVARLRAVCPELPGATEEGAWTGLRRSGRGRNFARVLMIHDAWPAAHASAAGAGGPASVLPVPRKIADQVE